MNSLSRVFILKIAATVVFWCIPLLLFPASVLEIAGLPQQESYIFIRMLGWAYLSLCVGYYFGLRASLAEKRSMGIIWVGIVSNSGACAYLFYCGLMGTWSAWSSIIQFIGWSSAIAAALITLGLLMYGVKGNEPIAD